MLMPNPINRDLRLPQAGERPKGRRADWRVAKPAIEAVIGRDQWDPV